VTQRLRLASFVLGPEPEGRGYRLLSQTGLPGGTSWQGSVPLVLSEWANLHCKNGFCGRFPVAGGAIALRAAFFGEGSAGPIARAHGVFLDEASLPMVVEHERSLFAFIPTPAVTNDFGMQPFEFALAVNHFTLDWRDLGLAWQDRQIFVDDDASLEDVALDVLASIDPPGQRARIAGWSTTALLAARGDFLPIQSCNLLVTRPDEPLANDRFWPVRISSGRVIAGDTVPLPGNYAFWLQLTEQFSKLKQPLGHAMVWHADMAGWSDVELAWRSIEILSQHSRPYADIVAAIVAMGDLPGENRSETSAATMQNYLAAVATHERGMVSKILALFRQLGADRPLLQAALDAASLSFSDPQLLAQTDDNELLRAIQLLRKQIEKGQLDGAAELLELLDDQSVWRAYRGNIKGTGDAEGDRRVHLNAIRTRLGFFKTSPALGSASLQRQKLFLRRQILRPFLDNRGA
jgi:hypothetical protein